jgi:hypothetical protein
MEWIPSIKSFLTGFTRYTGSYLFRSPEESGKTPSPSAKKSNEYINYYAHLQIQARLIKSTSLWSSSGMILADFVIEK